MRGLENKVAFITGAASGIGAACARRFAEAGAHIFAFDINEPEDCDDWTIAVKTAPSFQYVQADIRVQSSIVGAMKKAVEQHGSLDFLINAVGVTGSGSSQELDVKEWERIFDVNLRGTFLACRSALAIMSEQNGGAIVNIACLDDFRNHEATSAFNASKAAVLSLTKDLAVMHAPKGIRINAICPGFIETPAIAKLLSQPNQETFKKNILADQQMGRLGQPLEVANVAKFLCSDEASFVVGRALVVDGGFAASKEFGNASVIEELK